MPFGYTNLIEATRDVHLLSAIKQRRSLNRTRKHRMTSVEVSQRRIPLQLVIHLSQKAWLKTLLAEEWSTPTIRTEAFWKSSWAFWQSRTLILSLRDHCITSDHSTNWAATNHANPSLMLDTGSEDIAPTWCLTGRYAAQVSHRIYFNCFFLCSQGEASVEQKNDYLASLLHILFLSGMLIWRHLIE